ncbi:hypothetical protein KUL156_10750 [Alteromonas sp. KUL156]|nr:hypothetical protein KUL154_42910 [Alteromonas sp. KUL154]GFD98482.1 hypothetical protein KUL156_10750 [Alteromonas sp. KUL156]
MKYIQSFQLALFTLLLSASFNGTSAIIESRGYSLDTSTNIITGGGLEWLNWDETIGLSETEFNQSPLASSWRVASSREMYSLLNTFFEPSQGIDENLSRGQSVSGDTGPEFGDDFFSLFTGFRDNFCGSARLGCLNNTQNMALTNFGEDGLLKSLFIRDYFDWGNQVRGFINVKGSLRIGDPGSASNVSLALVRGVGSAPSQNPSNPTAVSEPNHLVIFSLLLIVAIRMRSSRR